MQNQTSSWILGTSFILGLMLASIIVTNNLSELKALERVVQVKGLAEREVLADTVIWPIKYAEVGNDLTQVVGRIEQKNEQISAFLKLHGFDQAEISVAIPAILDRQAGYQEQNYQQRYTATSIITVYSQKVDVVLMTMQKLIELSKNGIAINGADYDSKAEFLYTNLNNLKPTMIEEATRNAREVATKFAADSGSKVGKMKMANQGQFSISDRDSSTPHIKKVRVVATVDYYLADQ